MEDGWEEDRKDNHKKTAGVDDDDDAACNGDIGLASCACCSFPLRIVWQSR
jgi:hypothetical protein